MSLQSWGRYPQIHNSVTTFVDSKTLEKTLGQDEELIAYGNGRSYGDSALNEQMIHMKPYDYFLDFNEETGLLHVQAGILLSEILEYFVPRGWFLKVTPGTKFITVGGAIASDVHGKNHHIEGCFSQCLETCLIMLADGQQVWCSREETAELFLATCGGQGLTGIILEAKFYLKKINSTYLDQTTIKTANLKETFAAFEENSTSAYSVAWIDCLAKGEALGKSLLMLGEFRDDGELNYSSATSLSIPFNFPSWVLNKWSVKAFNWLYYAKVRSKVSYQKVGLNSFFYPLDSILNWNRIYGKKGFIQYQFIIPKKDSYQALEEILKEIAQAEKGSFLAVLKLYGKENDNYLSFPIEGYSLALDFRLEDGLFELLDRLDETVVKYHGRIYLAKDARVNKENFEKGYAKIEKFRTFRHSNKMDSKFQSLQSKRLGI